MFLSSSSPIAFRVQYRPRSSKQMLRLARTGLGPSSSPYLSRRLNHPPKVTTFAGNTAFITTDNSDVASLNSTSFFPRELDRQKTDYQTLIRVFEACKFSPNLRAVSGSHSAVVKLGYGTYQSLVSSLISAYIYSGCPSLARHLLNETPSLSFDVISVNSIITSFMMIGDIGTANKVFHDMPIRDVVSWNSMIGGYVKNGHFEEALRIFQEMICSNVEPDGFTFASAMSGCARLGARDYAKWIHGMMIEKKIELNNILGSALIDMYSRCGRIETAKEIFGAIKRDDISIWNAMINGLAVHGLAIDAIAIFSCMEAENVSPDSISFLGILTACSHCGLVEQGQKLFNLMMLYSVQPQLEHYGAMVDLFGRAGHLDEACALIKEMPMEPDIVIWRALLSACRTWRNSDLGEVAIKKIEDLNSGDYVLLSNIYCSVNKWDCAERLRSAMRKNGIRKNSGKSWIEMAGVIHKFKAGDQSHLERGAIYKVLESLIQRTKLEGFIPTIELVLMDVSDEEKEENLNYHSEKLALAYGILKTSPGMEIQIAKNLRTCPDCHSWMKIVSRMLNRVIIVRDRIRFHRFQGGLCTCGDYW